MLDTPMAGDYGGCIRGRVHGVSDKLDNAALTIGCRRETRRSCRALFGWHKFLLPPPPPTPSSLSPQTKLRKRCGLGAAGSVAD